MTVIFLIASITIFLTIDWLYRAIGVKKNIQSRSTAQSFTSTKTYYPRTPEGIFFSKFHVWCNLFPSGKVQMGIDDFIGVVVEHPKISLLKNTGETIKKGEPFAIMGNGSNLFTVQSPIDGEILEVNANLSKHTELLMTSPFIAGWMYTVKLNRFFDLKKFMLGPESNKWMMNEINRLRDFLAGLQNSSKPAVVTQQDGGLPNPHLINTMDSLMWKQFEEKFLHESDTESI